MIIIPIKEGENFERALKKFKRKFEKIGISKRIRSKQAFVKPSTTKRKQKIHAIYIQKIRQED